MRRDELVRYAQRLAGDRAIAEDVVQDAYLRLDRLEDGRALHDPLRYLYRIVHNLALDRRRQRLRENWTLTCVDGVAEQAADQRASPEDEIAARDDLRLLSVALAELPERMRIAVEMHRLGGCRLKEVAAHLGISVTSAHDLIIKAIEHCRRPVYTRT